MEPQGEGADARKNYSRIPSQPDDKLHQLKNLWDVTEASQPQIDLLAMIHARPADMRPNQVRVGMAKAIHRGCAGTHWTLLPGYPRVNASKPPMRA